MKRLYILVLFFYPVFLFAGGLIPPMLSMGDLPTKTLRLGSTTGKTFTLGTSSAVDGVGNIYVVGMADGRLNTGVDVPGLSSLFLAKYDSAGVRQWVQQVGVDEALTRATDVVASPSGIFVVGYTMGNLFSIPLIGIRDMILIKYDLTGARLWSRTLGSAGKEVSGESVALDSTGNILVVGTTSGAIAPSSLVGKQDILVAKYDSNGTLLWNVQKGVSSKKSMGVGVAVYQNGGADEVYIAGTQNESVGSNFIKVAKIDRLSGSTLWERTIGPVGADSTASGLAVDNLGNLFVSGTTNGIIGGTQYGSRDTFYLKLDPAAGLTVSSVQYGKAGLALENSGGLAIDASGNVYISGITTGAFDGQPAPGPRSTYLIKFDSANARVWSRILGVAGALTKGRAVSVTSGGTINIVGTTNGDLDSVELLGRVDTFAVQYSSAGNKNWTSLLGTNQRPKMMFSMSTASDSNSNVYIAGYTNSDLDGNPHTGSWDAFVTKFNKSGTRMWTRLLGDESSFTQGISVAVDSSNNVVVAGTTNGVLDGLAANGAFDFFVAKYDADGLKLWTRQYGKIGVVRASGVTVDSSGNVFVTGSTSSVIDGGTGSNSVDMFLAKYSAIGDLAWVRQTNEGGTGMTVGAAVVVDSANNILVTGSTTSATLDGQTRTGSADSFLMKYSSLGIRIWTRLLGTTGETVGRNIVTSGTDIFVSGQTMGGLGGNALMGIQDLFLAKYNSAGSTLWIKQIGSPSKTVFGGGGMHIDQNESLFIAGQTNGGLDGNALVGTQDFFITKYDLGGIRKWTKQFGGAGASTCKGMTVDLLGNIYVTGSTATDFLDHINRIGNSDSYLIKYAGN